MATTAKTADPAKVEQETQRIGRDVWKHLSHRRPSFFERRWWDERLMQWAMGDESVKVQMFRFVDVLPMLKTHAAVTSHLQEYFEEVREHLPRAARMVMNVSQPDSVLGRAVALQARSNARRMGERFIAGANAPEVMQSVAKMRRQGLAFTLDLLGEAVITEKEAEDYQNAYLDLIAGLAPQVNDWPENVQIDCDEQGPIPRVNVSLKLSSLDSQFSPVDPEGSAKAAKARLRTILRAAREHDAYVHVDMEHYTIKDLTLKIFKEILLEDEFRDFPDVGIVIQAYLPDAGRDLEDLLEWVQRRGTPVWVRLVKGAYWDYETIVARYKGWPIPVYQQKWKSDENFERQTRFLMENAAWLRPQLGSHNIRSLAHGIAWAKHLEVPPSAWEIQMLYGMGGDQAQLFSEMGHRVRIYTPFGEVIPGMAYLVRRLLENTSNDSFLRQSFTEHLPPEELLMNPTEVGKKTPPPKAEPRPRFTNEPHTDFSRPGLHEKFQQALDDVEGQLGEEHSLVIDGRAVDTGKVIESRNPAQKTQVVGRVAAAGEDEAYEAIDAARRTFPRWSRISPEHRAEYLELIAAEMRNRRFELAAWEVFECAKPWTDADGDICEAIDFCMYYAQEMRRLGVPRECDVPGEENRYFYRPRGVSVVIAPWNFPLAILTGMTVAALVTGNTVVIKPAEQSPVIAYKLMEILQNAGIPEGVANYLPGFGEDVGPALVNSPDVSLIAFTGSREVGLSINRQAAEVQDGQRFIKRVIAEMGGKNAIIVDDDADLDEAVAGTIHSAFTYSGQKCSACSRAIVLESAYDAYLERLVEAVKSLPIGPAQDPHSKVVPVIDEEARERIEGYIEIGKEEGKVAVARDVSDLAEEGHYVGPHVFTDVDPQARLCQEEIFGPVLAVMKAKDLDEAFDLLNDTDYDLTAGIYSRSPRNLQRAREEIQAGNIYLNRGIIGSLVERQPFGGFKLSGIGSKTGGPDYLQQFLVPVNVTENTMRRGFAPPEEEDD